MVACHKTQGVPCNRFEFPGGFGSLKWEGDTFTPPFQPLPSEVGLGNVVEKASRHQGTWATLQFPRIGTSIGPGELVSYVFDLKDTECLSGDLEPLKRIFINRPTWLYDRAKFITRNSRHSSSSVMGAERLLL